MSITSQAELLGMQEISRAVALTLKKMREYARPGMSAKELDNYGGAMLSQFRAKSAPKLTYNFPGWTCISVNNEIAHGIPSDAKIFKLGDLINIDVSAELDGFWSDNGGSFVLGEEHSPHVRLVESSKEILCKALSQIRGGVRIADIGKLIETEAKKKGFKVIKNLVGHGVGRSLHEEPHEIPNYYDKFNKERFKKNSVVAVETFISTKANYAYTGEDGWTLHTRDGSFVAQHEHTIVVTDNAPIILTKDNGIFD